MKTTIEITGQIQSVSTLKRAIQTINCESKKLRFRNECELIFNTKKEAVKALSNAFQELKSDEPDYYKEGGIFYIRGRMLEYDAAIAIII